MISETERREFGKFIPDGLYEAFPAFLSGIDPSLTFPSPCTFIY